MLSCQQSRLYQVQNRIGFIQMSNTKYSFMLSVKKNFIMEIFRIYMVHVLAYF